MAGRTRKEAHDAYLGPFRRAVQCVAAAHVFTSGYAERSGGEAHVVTCAPHTSEPRPWGADTDLPLVAATGERDLFLRITHRYIVVRHPSDQEREPYKIRPVRYGYGVLDRDGRELLVYQWHPTGISPVRAPHLHVSCAPTVALPLARGGQPREISVGRLHLPTNYVLLEDVIELLIREFGVEPQRDDWETVLSANRGVARRDPTWSWQTEDDHVTD